MKYPVSMRLLHWSMAIIILGMVWAGWTMVSLDDHVPAKFDIFYPWHKSFGMLVLLLVILRFTIRSLSVIPPLPVGLKSWERKTAKIAKVALYGLMVLVPCMGYCMSSSYTQSDGVWFFGVNLSELLPKNEDRFEVFRVLHRILAYTLLGVVALHAVGATKHRFFDRNRENDVFPSMF